MLLVNSSVCRDLHNACACFGGWALAGPVKTSYKLLCTSRVLGNNIIFPKTAERSDSVGARVLHRRQYVCD